MSTHARVSCDVCNKSNFKGFRYKCLICYDFDLCSECYDKKLFDDYDEEETGHSNEHPMQCIMTNSDLRLYLNVDPVLGNRISVQSFTCPCCAEIGFSITELITHVNNLHPSDQDEEFLCPVCVSLSPQANEFISDIGKHLKEKHVTSRPTTAFSGFTTASASSLETSDNINESILSLQSRARSLMRRNADSLPLQSILEQLDSMIERINNSNATGPATRSNDFLEPLFQHHSIAETRPGPGQIRSTSTSLSRSSLANSDLSVKNIEKNKVKWVSTQILSRNLKATVSKNEAADLANKSVFFNSLMISLLQNCDSTSNASSSEQVPPSNDSDEIANNRKR